MDIFAKIFSKGDDLKQEETQKSMMQSLAEMAINHYSKDAVVAGLDFIAGLSEDDLKEWTAGLIPEQAARVYRVWRAAQIAPETVSVELSGRI